MPDKRKNALLWRIGNDAPFSYLFGTMHLKDQVAYTYINIASRYIDECPNFKLEIDLDEAQEISSPTDYLMPNRQSLMSLLGDRKYDKAKRVLQKYVDINLDGVQFLYPILTVNLITEKLLQEDYEVALDHYLWQYARQKDKKCGGIESYEIQKNTLRNIDLEVQVSQFNELWRHMTRFKRKTRKITQLYASGDIHALYKAAMSGIGSMKEEMLVKRNAFMFDHILNGLDSPTFYAVGAAHLGGFYGLIHQLKNNGIECKPVWS